MLEKETFQFAIQIAQAIGSIATAILVYLTWHQVKHLKEQVRQARDQAKTSFEDNLTEEYRKVMEDIPLDIWLGAELKALATEPDRQNRCRDAIYRYIDLSQEEAFLHRKNRIRDDTWIDWCKGIKANMDLPAFKEVWTQVTEKWPKSFEELRAVL